MYIATLSKNVVHIKCNNPPKKFCHGTYSKLHRRIIRNPCANIGSPRRVCLYRLIICWDHNGQRVRHRSASAASKQIWLSRGNYPANM